MKEGWRPLADVLERSIGGVWGSDPGRDELDVRVIRVTELGDFGRIAPATAALRSISKQQFASRALRTGDLLLEKSGGGPKRAVGRVGMVGRLSEPSVCANFMQLMRPNPNLVNPRFLHLYLIYFHLAGGTAPMQTATTNIRNIKASEYTAIDVPVPPLAEQIRVVEVLEAHLSRLDAGQADLQRSAGRLESLKLGYLSRVRRDLDDQLEAVELAEVCTTTLGKMLDAKKQVGVPTPYLRNINVRWGEFDLSDVKETLLTDDERARLTVEPGDLMVCEGGEPGRCAVWRDDAADFAFQKALHRVRPRDPSSVDSEFVALMLTEAIRSGRLSRLFTGTTIKHLPQDKLRTITLPIPSIAEQRKVVSAWAAMQTGVERLGRELVEADLRAEGLRKAVLAATFTGQLSSPSTSDPDARTPEIVRQEELSCSTT